MQEQKEVWLPVKSYEGVYEVSNLGRVRSLDRMCKHSKGDLTIKGRIKKTPLSSRGYVQVGLCLDGVCKTRQVHQLMAVAFLGHKICGHKIVVDHIDNNRLNNNLDNLQLTTARNNTSKDVTGKTSKYTGVSLHKPSNKWEARIQIKGKNKYLGLFSCELKAAAAYQKALKEI